MGALDEITFNEIVQLVMPQMDSHQVRQAFVTQALADAPMLLQQIKVEGDALQFTTHLIRACDEFGQIAPGRLAVVAVLEHGRDRVAEPQKIDSLIATITKSYVETPFEFIGETGKHIFISYSRANLPLVQRLTRDLVDCGVRVWIDKIGLKPSTPDWENALRDAIKQSDGVILVASPSSRQSAYVRDEIAIARAANRPLYPVWADGNDWSDCIPMGMGYIQFVDMRGNAYEAGLEEIVRALKGLPASPEGEVRPHRPVAQLPIDFKPRNPYKGLRAFREEDRRDFFGRDALIAECVKALDAKETRFLAVVGASGSGKSSVVMAGVLPKLREGGIKGSENWRYLDPIVPGNHPLENLTIALSDIFPEKSQTSIREDLDNPSTRGLHMLAKQAARHSRLVLYIDQFEELFTLTASEDERRQFIDLLTTAVTEPDGVLIVVLSLRADFYDRPLEYNTLGNLLKAQTVPVLPLTLADLLDVIEAPARLDDVQIRFENGLVTDLLFTVRDEIGALPLLQFTLDQLFERRNGQIITRAAYQQIGGVRGALTKHAEQTYLQLPSEEHRRLARALFLRLIEPGATEQETTRRRASLNELKLLDAQQTVILKETASIFVDSRLLVAEENTLEVAHEALIREWERLKNWLTEAREELRLQKKVNVDATNWVWAGRPENYGGFYTGTLLADAQYWMQHNVASIDETAFVKASEQADRSRRERDAATARRVQNFQRASVVLGLTVILAVIAGLVAGLAASNAQQRLNLAGTSESNSVALRQTVESDATISGVEQARASTLIAALGALPQFAETLNPQQVIDDATLVATRVLWTPVVQTFDGVEMVNVPAGCFWMGDNFDSDTRPVHRICFDSDFWIDRFEVTNKQFNEMGGIAALPSRWTKPRYPRTDVSWEEAEMYCEGRDARLPTEPEWEYAARGPNSLRNPWGNELDLEKIAFGNQEPEPVGKYPDGVSWVGAYDMSGNVWERVSSLYREFPYNLETHESSGPSEYYRVIKGGAFDNIFPIANRDRDFSYLPIGFRCARD